MSYHSTIAFLFVINHAISTLISRTHRWLEDLVKVIRRIQPMLIMFMIITEN